jgi:hypothetical protein
MDSAFSSAQDSVKGLKRGLLGQEKTWQDEVGEMCPSLTYTQARPGSSISILSICPSLFPTTSTSMQRRQLTPQFRVYSDSGVLEPAALWDSSSAWGCVALLSQLARAPAAVTAYAQLTCAPARARDAALLRTRAAVPAALRRAPQRRPSALRADLLGWQHSLHSWVRTQRAVPLICSGLHAKPGCASPRCRDRCRTSFIVGERQQHGPRRASRRHPPSGRIPNFVFCRCYLQVRAPK